MKKVLIFAEHDASGLSGILGLNKFLSQIDGEMKGVIVSFSSQAKSDINATYGKLTNVPVDKNSILSQLKDAVKGDDIGAVVINLIHQKDLIKEIALNIKKSLPPLPQILVLANGNEERVCFSKDSINNIKDQFLPTSSVAILPGCCSNSIMGVEVFDQETALQAAQSLVANTKGAVVVLYHEEDIINAVLLFQGQSFAFYKLKIKSNDSDSLSFCAQKLSLYLSMFWIGDNQTNSFKQLNKYIGEICDSYAEL